MEHMLKILLNQWSYQSTTYKATTIKTLTREAQIICDLADDLRNENECLQQVFH